MNLDLFFEPNFCLSQQIICFVYTNHGNNTKRLGARKYYLLKDIIKSYNVIINEKKLLWPSNWLQYKTINQSMFVFEKTKETRLTFSQESVTVL